MATFNFIIMLLLLNGAFVQKCLTIFSPIFSNIIDFEMNLSCLKDKTNLNLKNNRTHLIDLVIHILK